MRSFTEQQQHTAAFSVLQSATSWKLNLILLIGAFLATFNAYQHMFQGWWYPIQQIMEHPTSLPVFGHRVLFIGVAWLFKLALGPKLGFVGALLCSQLVALAFTFVAMTLFIRRMVGAEFMGIGAAITALCLIATFSYFNFYDIALVGFHATCLLLLFERRFVWYFAAYAIGLTNHENLLLLLPVAVLWLWQEKRLAAIIGGVHVFIFGLYRVAITHWISRDTVFDNRLWQNIHAFSFYSLKGWLLGASGVVLMFVGAIVAFRSATNFLKIAAIGMFPGLFLVTFLFGQFNESRQFDAFIPQAVAIIACGLKEMLEPRTQAELSEFGSPPGETQTPAQSATYLRAG